MKKTVYILLVLLISLCPFTANAGAPSEEYVTFNVMSSDSQPVAGVTISGGKNPNTIQEYGTTGKSGSMTVLLPLGSYTFTSLMEQLRRLMMLKLATTKIQYSSRQ